MTYDPQLPEGTRVINLTPATESEQKLTPETDVIVINRGFQTLERMYAGDRYPLQPHTVGLMKMPYGAALHFQKHTTVPGTRDPETNAEQSFIGILGIDPPEMCQPFTPEECERFGLVREAIARRDPDEVHAVPVNEAMATGKIPQGRGRAGGASSRKGVAFTQGKTADGDTVDVKEVMTAGEETAAERIERLNAEAE